MRNRKGRAILSTVHKALMRFCMQKKLSFLLQHAYEIQYGQPFYRACKTKAVIQTVLYTLTTATISNAAPIAKTKC